LELRGRYRGNETPRSRSSRGRGCGWKVAFRPFQMARRWPDGPVKIAVWGRKVKRDCTFLPQTAILAAPERG